MHPLRKRRLLFLAVWGGLCVAVGWLVLYAMRQNISLFYTPSEVFAGRAPLAVPIRVGGMVEKGSVLHDASGKLIFAVTDYHHQLRVAYAGLLPDLFREGQGVVVNGQLTASHDFIATEVLAKHDARYMPPEVRSMLHQDHHVG